ncbi:MAG: hypothetical protein GWP04_05885 [Gammaproteobacteria bacterium]|nr:hypothetical protein [Gammaproteobacteria bacterium]
MRSRLRKLVRPGASENGAVLVWAAGSLVVLLAFAALSVDLTWLYLNTSRLQNAADAAALAGVVNLPGFMDKAQEDADAAAAANGYPGGGVELVPLADNSLQVVLTTSVPTYLLRIIGFDQFTIARRSTAQYIKPVPIGSPDNCFGEAPVSPPGTACTGGDPNFWAAISGRRTNKFNGDAFATEFWDDPWSGSHFDNTQYRPAGYYYGIEVAPGSSDLTVHIYDAGFYNRRSLSDETGDREQDDGGGTDTHFKMYAPDTTPLDPTDNPPITGCQFDIPSGYYASTYKNRWAELCNVSSSLTPGIYVLRVWTDGTIGGTNQYSVHASVASGSTPHVYGINDISIFTNQPSTTSILNLAKVEQIHAGKRLELHFYDPGEDNGDAYMTVKMPDGTTAQCSWYSEDEYGNTTTPPGEGGFGACRIQTSDGSPIFNGQWVTANVEIPSSYTCTSNCWWYMEIELNQPHDRTTWMAQIIGNPVRLIANP